MSEAPPGQNWEFDGFTMLPEMRLLLKGGVAMPLTPKAFDTLGILIANRDRVVSKDELLRSVWPDVVVEEGNLTQQIFLLRKALGENAQQSRYIVTVPGHGYRFTARVKATSGGAPSAPVAAIVGRRSIPVGHLAIGGVALLAIALGAAWRARDNMVSPPMDLAKARPIRVTESGKAIRSAASADGRYVAYVEDHGDQHSLWVRTASGGRTEVVAQQPSLLSSLTFSPDGEYLYFTRQRRGVAKFDLSRIPSSGGVESPVLDDVDTPISFSPDRRKFAFARGNRNGSTDLLIAPADGGLPKTLPISGDPVKILLSGPDWSPDGKMLAAAAVESQRNGPRRSIRLFPIDGSPSLKVHSTDSWIGQVRWLPDGKSLLAVQSEALTRQFPPWHGETFQFSGGPIWRIYTDRRAPEQLTSDLIDHDLCCLHLVRNGTEITSVINSLVSDLWVAPSHNLNERKRISSDKPTVTRHAWLPDNETVAYRDLSGALNVAHRASGIVGLSLPAGLKVAGGVSACGAGPYIVFAGVPGNNIWRVASNAAGAFQLTHGTYDSNPACSPDGKWVMYSSSEPGNISVKRVSIEGGDAKPLVPSNSFDALPSPDGRLMYYSASHWDEHGTRSPRWVVRSITDPQPLFSFPAPKNISFGVPPVWAPDNSGLDYVVTTMGVSNIWRKRLPDAQPEQVTHFSAGKIFSFAWSPDGKWLSFAGDANRSDVVTLSR